MAEGLRIVTEMWRRAQERQKVQNLQPLSGDVYVGLSLAVLLLSDPDNRGLWERLVKCVEGGRDG